MLQIIDKETQLPVTPKLFESEAEALEKLDAIHREKLERSARGRAMIASGDKLSIAYLKQLYNIRWAEGVWLRATTLPPLPYDSVVVCVKATGTNTLCCFCPDDEGFMEDSTGRVLRLGKITEYFILPDSRN